ncbi:hypothetical protein Droror1_Dr00014400 [Drosera rotundifolia]
MIGKGKSTDPVECTSPNQIRLNCSCQIKPLRRALLLPPPLPSSFPAASSSPQLETLDSQPPPSQPEQLIGKIAPITISKLKALSSLNWVLNVVETEMAQFQDLREVDPKVAELEESNALALAIIPPGSDPQNSNRGLTDLIGTSGWELALVTTPSLNISQPPESKLAGGFDKLLLDSLYEDEAARR